MRYNSRENAKFALNSSVVVTLISTILFVIGVIYMVVVKDFQYWWIFLIVVIIQVIVSLVYCYIAIFKIKIDGYYNREKISSLIFWLVIVEGLTLNVFAFLYGLYSYRKVFHGTKIFW
ncbi:hypothetical protein CXP39_02930 [Mesoplasma syrphidae]|uniref:Uncharacterized protein n=1 Tax=Mesoplasma syrphidae TaxID=225999 RepID=A0A2K9C2N8_9MOLU|nr:hypothetical protein [Mesoplasma syrphidae]AUF83739.1 hypothetical protein CXP39_02930 [Mesoplasma syrphidae]